MYNIKAETQYLYSVVFIHRYGNTVYSIQVFSTVGEMLQKYVRIADWNYRWLQLL